MASSILYRFRSLKEPARVSFDGTGISVFELKREIIHQSNLGDGNDFDLILASDDTKEVFDDDTTTIPRSSSVTVSRLPPSRPGKGNAAKYVNGTIQPLTRRQQQNPEKGKSHSIVRDHGIAVLSEEARLKSMGQSNWDLVQETMAGATRIVKPGHFIQDCPTNDDPDFDNKRRILRTTGIPKSFLQRIERPNSPSADGLFDDTKPPPGAMLNAENEWVVALPDSTRWNQAQSIRSRASAAQEVAKLGHKDLQDLGLECDIDKQLYDYPTKTPCCDKTYCRDCIVNALLDNDLRCPNCASKDVLIDDLKEDKSMQARVNTYKNANTAQEADVSLESSLRHGVKESSGSRSIESAQQVPNKRKAPEDTPESRSEKRML